MEGEGERDEKENRGPGICVLRVFHNVGRSGDGKAMGSDPFLPRPNSPSYHLDANYGVRSSISLSLSLGLLARNQTPMRNPDEFFTLTNNDDREEP